MPGGFLLDEKAREKEDGEEQEDREFQFILLFSNTPILSVVQTWH